MGTDSLLSFFDTLAPLPAAGLGDTGTLRTFGGDSVGGSKTVGELAAKTTDKGYRGLVQNINTTSYSILERLHTCPRAFALDKLKATNELNAGIPEPLNIHFIYGHSVGAGVQGLLAHGNALEAGLLAGFLSWKADYDYGTDEYLKKKNKSMVGAQVAIMKFRTLLEEHDLLSQYEVMRLEGGTPAIELSFCLDTGDGYQYYGHIDVIIKHKYTGRLAILELKTTGLRSVNEAMYANSNQALGYAVALDAIAQGVTDYDVIYCSYLCGAEEWKVMEFHKSLRKRAEWLQDILLDHAAITSYRKLNHFPKNGSNCVQFMTPCSWFGECDHINKAKTAALPVLDTDQRAEVVDYYFTLDDIIASQRAKRPTVGEQ